MKNVDYIIVGDGYAGLFFAHQLIRNNKSFVIFSEGRKSASQVSAGIINPVVLKKFTTFWKAQEQIDFLKNSLREIETYTGKNYLIDAPIHRIFHDENEQKLWLKKSANEELSGFLSEKFERLNGVKNDFQTGKVNQSARLDVNGFFSGLFDYFEKNDFLIREKFEYTQLDPARAIYKDFNFKNIIFCEGMRVRDNPYFSEISVNPNKGHHIKVRLSQPIPENITIKKKHFLFPTGTGLYFYGGTYDRDQLHHHIDESAVDQLVKGLSEIYPYDFDVEEVHFGFRPTVKDRRPIIGRHETHDNLYVFNGLGARGILNGCYFARDLFRCIEEGVPLHEEVSSDRFK
ncbi:FAD-binding oxidoreductase [Chryseobacterium indologenes]|uniref:NAD(P)/FAD-dependent oxidoreductase n=1 Tax=Chryseobacterium indologenes TaxID=253 RepID=UPI000F4F17B8|nr:FAD-dependent oxidoreductase [Chryseobacterium indologenes]AYZ37031.1 FAD-binding oxidoreductase [Chryseobacterium indologenes]MBF6645871.1 FAD-binding oxidoreductase [Chryseobacterium indologenes]MBU3048932.1 FAD-binding oxidoreductase [Chryseobacterium indologenes]MEB4760916.1 FAD-dependent oxidoreductase [Chryseobacterium indologenes]QQQ70465.1 FAD-binding oxidoreductase [Chryseobacterium indologenes]